MSSACSFYLSVAQVGFAGRNESKCWLVPNLSRLPCCFSASSVLLQLGKVMLASVVTDGGAQPCLVPARRRWAARSSDACSAPVLSSAGSSALQRCCCQATRRQVG